MNRSHQVYLVPGFFGFTDLGAYNYFFRVADILQDKLKQDHQIDAEVISCPTQPTSSIQRRANVILDTVEASGGLQAKTLHFVGHSTGGLDIRLLITPGVRLRPDRTEIKIGERTKSLTTISTPHFGTPLANFFTTFQGRRVLEILTMLANNKAGRFSLFCFSRLMKTMARADDWLGRHDTFLDLMTKRLFDHVTLDPDDPIWRFLEEVRSDQGAIIQLTPEGMHLYNAAVADREGVDYRCIATTVKPPSLRQFAGKLRTPTNAVSHFLFYLLHSITAREHKHYPYPSPADSLGHTLKNYVSFPVTAAANDGIAPVLSQLYGELIDVEIADHMDVVGQFESAGNERFTDWLVSGAGYNEARFQATWSKVAAKIVASIERQ